MSETLCILVHVAKWDRESEKYKERRKEVMGEPSVPVQCHNATCHNLNLVSWRALALSNLLLRNTDSICQDGSTLKVLGSLPKRSVNVIFPTAPTGRLHRLAGQMMRNGAASFNYTFPPPPTSTPPLLCWRGNRPSWVCPCRCDTETVSHLEPRLVPTANSHWECRCSCGGGNGNEQAVRLAF